MSAANNLEALINLEQNLKSQYEQKFAAETQKLKGLEENQAALKKTIDKQLAQITEMSAGRVEQRRLEQENREMGNRVGNLQKELDTLRAKSKAAQKDLIEAKATVKTLKQLDAEKLKKNLVATKNTLLEQRKANELLSKKNKSLKVENNELTHSNEELKKELEELKPKETEETKSEGTESTKQSKETKTEELEALTEE